jgi:hypothetical protein
VSKFERGDFEDHTACHGLSDGIANHIITLHFTNRVSDHVVPDPLSDRFSNDIVTVTVTNRGSNCCTHEHRVDQLPSNRNAHKHSADHASHGNAEYVLSAIRRSA